MNIISLYGKEIFSLLVPIFTLILNKFFKNSAKMCYGELHQFTYLINDPHQTSDGEIIAQSQIVHTHSYIFTNEGREPATSVEIIFNYAPMYLNVWPSRHYELKGDKENRHILKFDYLAPQETIRCEVMSINTPLPELLSVRAKEGLAKKVGLYPQKIFSPVLINFFRLLIFLGSVNLVYLVLLLLQWLIVKTG
ncbi:hypothetical protein NMD73_06020 [Edwardsiella tarda]|uniref:hypothetical protein n=1 Tax=Edwardsiella tarda TaxID=636 RepID=UPI00351C86EC